MVGGRQEIKDMMIICHTEQPKTWHSAGVRKRTLSLAIDIALGLEWGVATWRSLLQVYGFAVRNPPCSLRD